MEKFITACPRNCYSTCSLTVWRDQGKIVKIEPHDQNRATPEGTCLKGLSYVERANSKERILYPLKRENGQFRRVSWETAFKEIANKLHHFRQTYGMHSVLYYYASGMSGLLNGNGLSFWKMLGGATTVYGNLCWPAGLEASRLTLGENKHNVAWDLENANLIVLWGKNPAETNIQQEIPIAKAQKKGAILVVVDPRRTPSSERADLLIQPVPGTDAALALAVAHLLINENFIDEDFIKNHVLGFDAFKKHVANCTPEWAEKICSVPSLYIQKLARLIGTIKPMTIVPGYGMQRYSNGGQTIRSVLALQILTGNIGKKGACWHYADLQSYVFSELKEPETYYPDASSDSPFRRKISTAKLGEDMLRLNEPPIKMIWVERGNPLSQNPNRSVNIKAFRSAEYRVVVEQFMTDTALEADLVLPAKNMFEQSDLIGSYWNPYIQLKQKVIEPAGEVKPETEVYWHLAGFLGFSEEERRACLIPPGDDAVDEVLQMKLDKFGIQLDELRKGPVLAPNLQEIAFEDLVFKTPSGKIELQSEQASDLWGVHPLPSYEPLKEGAPCDKLRKEYPLQLMSPNTKNRIHSQFGNLEVIKQFDAEPHVIVSAKDAKLRNVRTGDRVKVFNVRGEIVLKAKIDFSLKPGCVVVYNGYWASEGAAVNELSQHMETDMGYGTAFHDNLVELMRVE